MKHILFPTVDAADSFIADMQQQGIAQLDSGSATVQRRGMATGTSNMTGTDANYATTADDQRVAEEAGEGAVKGTGVGAVVGAAAGALTTAGVLGTAAATAATVATGGLALPVILGMAAAGAGVGAAVGAAGGAAGAEDGNMGGGRYPSSYEVDDGHYDQISQTLDAGGRAVAVEDSISSAALEATMQRYGGHFV